MGRGSSQQTSYFAKAKAGKFNHFCWDRHLRFQDKDSSGDCPGNQVLAAAVLLLSRGMGVEFNSISSTGQYRARQSLASCRHPTALPPYILAE